MFSRDPMLTWMWYKWRTGIVFKARPNSVHRSINKLESMNIFECVIMRNTDGLHRLVAYLCT